MIVHRFADRESSKTNECSAAKLNLTQETRNCLWILSMTTRLERTGEVSRFCHKVDR